MYDSYVEFPEETRLDRYTSVICKKPYLIAPGSTVTKDPTMFLATGKFLVSKTLTDPPLKGVAVSAESL